MKINKVAVIALLAAVGFDKAKDFNDEKLLSIIPSIPEKIELDAVPEEHKDVYNKIRTANGSGDDFELVSEPVAAKAKGAKPAGAAKGKATGKPAAKAKPAGAAKAPKEAKPAKVKAVKAVKAPKVEKAKVELDKFGARPDSNRGIINKVVADGDWFILEDIVPRTKLTAKQVQYEMRRNKSGNFEREIRYRIRPAKKN